MVISAKKPRPAKLPITVFQLRHDVYRGVTVFAWQERLEGVEMHPEREVAVRTGKGEARAEHLLVQ